MTLWHLEGLVKNKGPALCILVYIHWNMFKFSGVFPTVESVVGMSLSISLSLSLLPSGSFHFLFAFPPPPLSFRCSLELFKSSPSFRDDDSVVQLTLDDESLEENSVLVIINYKLFLKDVLNGGFLYR